MKIHNDAVGSKTSKIRIERPAIQTPEEERLWQDVSKFSKLIPSEPEPNLGQVREIRDAIKNGAYLKPEMIEETAARLTLRFMRKE